MENIRIQDDLYMYVNQETLENLVIPDDKPTAGGFSELSDSVEKMETNALSDNNINALSTVFDEVDVVSIVENGMYFKYTGEGLNPELDAFMNYCEDIGVFDEVPQNLQYYIDYEKYYMDMKFSGMTVIEIDYYTYMYVFY